MVVGLVWLVQPRQHEFLVAAQYLLNRVRQPGSRRSIAYGTIMLSRAFRSNSRRPSATSRLAVDQPPFVSVALAPGSR
ncbi:MAG TPA: hypothetical protein VK836_14515 [Streptosporangiaceae bacterium]|nr:hypothetical protein [Streptosporangiaceae bacterium]